MSKRWTLADVRAAKTKQLIERGAKNKFNAKKIVVDGIEFDSKHEAEYWHQLQLRAKAGEIWDVVTHVNLEFSIGNDLIFWYVADFRYTDASGKHYADAKGLRRGAAYQLFKLKKKIIEKYHQIVIEEV